jgi:hypothetical protein
MCMYVCIFTSKLLETFTRLLSIMPLGCQTHYVSKHLLPSSFDFKKYDRHWKRVIKASQSLVSVFYIQLIPMSKCSNAQTF